MKEENNNCRIHKSVEKRSGSTNMITETKELLVTGNDLKECKEVFDSEWGKDE